LLPRRRRRGAEDDPFGIDEDESENEVDISGLGNEDDELAHLDVRARRRPTSRVSARNQAKNQAKNQATTQGVSSHRNKNNLAQGPNKRLSRTYSRLSDKENQAENEDEEGSDSSLSPVPDDLGEEDSQMLVARVGEELKNAVRKFEEVDKWELSFEERSRSESPLDAR
jgi:hypothetical protein